MARPYRLNGGKTVFPRHVGNGILDIQALRQEIEQAEAVITVWTRKRDRLQKGLDVRLGMLQHDVEGHETVVSGNATSQCRSYHCSDPACKTLECLARRLEAERDFPLPVA